MLEYLARAADLTEIRETMQAAIAPAFLLNGIMAGLAMLSLRLSRILDRDRADIYVDSGVGYRLRARQVPFRQAVANLDRMTFFNGWNTPQTMWLDGLRVETRAHGGL